jgi:hypothetical protein
MTDEQWRVANEGSSKRRYFLYRRGQGGTEYSEGPGGKLRRFASPDAAAKAAAKLNGLEYEASAFDGVNEADVRHIKQALWAGQSMASIRRDFIGLEGKFTFSAARLREMRDELFEPLTSDPAKLAEMANGAIINALELNRPRKIADKFTRTARQASRPVQVEMFQ